jgi:hypothetical protein
MPSRIFDNPLSRRLAGILEQEHNQTLGIRNTMRLARAYNRVKNLHYQRFRQDLYQHHREALLAENGPTHRPAVKISDGWVLDTSKTLPHLDELLTASQEIIHERGGVKRGGGDRSFFQQILTDEHIRRFPAILNFATSSDVLQTVIDYMGFLPVLSASKPLGVRLNESDARFAEPHGNGFCESQLFHCDYHDSPMVYMIVALRDVTVRSGPFSFLPAGASQRAATALHYGRRGRSYRISDEEMYSVAGRDDLIELVCPAGTVLFLDSSVCFHYGSRNATIPRYLMMYAYLSVCRTDFGDLLRKESPKPVLDDSSRVRRAKYPIGCHDSLLRRLILDRECLNRDHLDRTTTYPCSAALADDLPKASGHLRVSRQTSRKEYAS